jgi:ribosome maturation factor RimP
MEFGLADLQRITAVIEPEVRSLGFDPVRVRLFQSREIGDDDELTLQVMAENPATGQLVLDQCAALSRRISDRFDELEAAGEVLIENAYRLEVSSPGIDRPLTRLRDFVEWAGHEAKVQLSEPVDGNRKALHGDLAGVDGETVLLDDRKSGRVGFPFADVSFARLVLTDRLIAASRPLDTSGADVEEIEIEDLDSEDGDHVLAQQED